AALRILAPRCRCSSQQMPSDRWHPMERPSTPEKREAQHMKPRKLGNTGLTIGPLGLGSVNFSWLTNEADSFTIMDHAFNLGVNFLDTSDNYNAGQTEALIGRWFKLGGGRREKTVLATKVFSAPMEWGSSDPVKRTGSWVGPNQKGLSAKHIREACEASLKRLNTDYID